MTWQLLLIAALAALVLIAGARLLSLLRRRRQRRARPVPRDLRPIHPLVLVHGLLGFAEMGMGRFRAQYFRGVVEHLARMGVTAYCPQLPPVASMSARAQRLAELVRALPAGHVNLVGHSQGGLDARYAVAHCGLADVARSVTTIGSPHRGTGLADLGTDALLGKLGLGRLLGFLGVDIEVFYELTVARMARFNEQVPDRSGVAYGSIVGALAPGSSAVHQLLRPCFAYLARHEGANDGLVGGASQRWGDVLAEVEADHLAQIGWSARFDALGLYEELVRELRGRGL